jgi:O-antigen ligase
VWAVLAALGVLLGAAIASPWWTGLPTSLVWSSAGLMLAAAFALVIGAGVQSAGLGLLAFRALCIGLVVAGVANSLLGLVQVFAPGLTDGTWIERSAFVGRAAGNMRQPNHLSSLLLWSLAAVAWLAETRALNRAATWIIGMLLMLAVVLSASRTGAIGAVMLAAWGGVDRRLSRPTRVYLIAAPLAYLIFWLGMSTWATQTDFGVGWATRFDGEGGISSSRFAIWKNALSLVASHPWLGVGFGEFNFAWSLTPFSGRPTEFFSHTHNLPLQLAVELGLPLALLVLALLVWALWRALKSAVAASADGAEGQASILRAAFVIVLLISFHSLLEYPLWYAYFLLPAAFAFGLCLGRAVGEPGALPSDRDVAEPSKSKQGNGSASREMAAGRQSRPLLMVALLLLFGTVAALVDYSRVVVIFSPIETGSSLTQRVNDGRRSWFFAHHAGYAADTTAGLTTDPKLAFKQAPHNLLDAKLMMAWAIALDQAGDVDRARYMAQRLKEFRNPRSDEFFKLCEVPAPPGGERPFQCLAPTHALTFEDFR